MKISWIHIAALIGLTVLIIIVLANSGIFFGKRINSPAGQVTKTQELERETEPGVVSTREIMMTEGVKHTVTLKEIISGGPPKDGIPSIDNPKFVSAGEASQWLSDQEPGVAFSKGNTNRFYPYQILVWHEIVNDIVEGERVLITYCPLCLTGIVFDPEVKGEKVEFGTSGMLWKSNLVMYDRKTDSLWSQVLGESIVGEMAGTKLKVLPSDQIRFGDFKKNYPQGQVLSKDTGIARFYGSNPYGGYFTAPRFALSLADFKDTRLPADSFVFGIVVNDKAKAYDIESVEGEGEIEDVFEGRTFVLRYDKNLDAVRMYEKTADAKEQRITPFSAFWFSWAAGPC